MLNVAIIREKVDRWLVDHGQIYTPGEPVLDPDTLELVDGPPVVHYDGPMMLYPHTETSSAEAGQTVYDVKKYDLVLPADVTVQIDQKVRLTSSRYDLALVDVEFVVTDAALNTYEVAQTVIVTRVT